MSYERNYCPLNNKDVLSDIFLTMHPRDVFKLSRVNKLWYQVIYNKNMWLRWVGKDSNQGLFLLFLGIRRGLIEHVTTITQFNLNINTPYPLVNKVYLPLEYAFEKKQRSIILMLVQNGATLTLTDFIRRKEFIWSAVCMGYADVVDAMLQRGINPNTDVRMLMYEGYWSHTLLYKAAEDGDLEIIKVLIKRKVNIDQGATEYHRLEGDIHLHYNVPPIFIATKKGHYHIVKSLLEAGADLFLEIPVWGSCWLDGVSLTDMNIVSVAFNHNQIAIAALLRCAMLIQTAIRLLRMAGNDSATIKKEIESCLLLARKANSKYFEEYFAMVLSGSDYNHLTGEEIEELFQLKIMQQTVLREKTKSSCLFFKDRNSFYQQYSQKPNCQLTVQNDQYLMSGL